MIKAGSINANQNASDVWGPLADTLFLGRAFVPVILIK